MLRERWDVQNVTVVVEETKLKTFEVGKDRLKILISTE